MWKNCFSNKYMILPTNFFGGWSFRSRKKKLGVNEDLKVLKTREDQTNMELISTVDQTLNLKQQ